MDLNELFKIYSCSFAKQTCLCLFNVSRRCEANQIYRRLKQNLLLPGYFFEKVFEFPNDINIFRSTNPFLVSIQLYTTLVSTCISWVLKPEFAELCSHLAEAYAILIPRYIHLWCDTCWFLTAYNI